MPTDLIIFADGAGRATPFHPILVNFTAGLLPVCWLFDVLGAILKKDVLHAVGWWTLLVAAVITPFTAASGWWWWWAEPGEHAGHWQMPIHQWLGTGLAVAVLAVAAWRWRLYRKGRPGLSYLAVLTLLVVALFFQGDLGGSMSFGRGLIFHSAERPAEEEVDHEHP